MKKVIVCFLLLFSAFAMYGSIIVAENGKSRAEIVVGKNPPYVVQFAAKELSEFLGRAAKCKIPVKESSNAPVRIYLGNTIEAKKAGYLPKASDHIISIRKDGTIFLLGKDDAGTARRPLHDLMLNTAYRGTLETVYTFLEKYIGVRWLEPGKDGEYVPASGKIVLQPVEENIIPAFEERRTYHFQSLWASYLKYSKPPLDLKDFEGYNSIWLWGLRMRYTDQRHAPVNGCHTPAYLYLDKELYPQHPEYFALQKDGSRSPRDLCWSNPAVEDFWYRTADAYFRGDPNPQSVGLKSKSWNVNMFGNPDEFMIDPHDYLEYFCQCKNCEAYRKPYGKNGQGELIYKVIFNVAEKIHKKYPGKRITTLVYPPKRFFPADKKIPPNLRVRITYPWVSIDPDSQQRKDALALTKQWNKGANQKAYLWLYLISTFAYTNYGVPEAVAHEMQKLLQDVQKDTIGIFYEHSEPSQTIRNIDQYMIGHLLWDPYLDLDKMMDEYFAAAFGKAAPEMRSFYAELERKWKNVSKMYSTHGENSKQLRNIFDSEYKYTELVRLEKIINNASAKVAKNSPEWKRIERFRKYVLEIAKNEFSIHSSDKVNSFNTAIKLYAPVIDRAPTDSDWAKLPYISLNPAKGTALTRKSQFKVFVTDDIFYLRGKFDEPSMAKSKTDLKRKQGDWNNIWEDNIIELFFADDKGDVMQMMVNDNGIYAFRNVKTNKWFAGADGVKCSAKRSADGFMLDIAVPHSISKLDIKSAKSCFNITRTVQIEGLEPEFATFSPKCPVGRWTMAQCYAVLKTLKLKPIQEFSGKAKAVSNKKTVVFASVDKTSNRNFWAFWNPAHANCDVYRDKPSAGHSKFGPFAMKYQDSNKVDEAKFAASWRYWTQVPPRGSTVRVTAYYRAETQNPNAALGMNINWLDAKRRWYKGGSHDLAGKVVKRAVNRDWQKISVEVPVPDVADIHYISVTFSPIDMRPGTVWFDDLQIEVVK